jgi:hypothetical protein
MLFLESAMSRTAWLGAAAAASAALIFGALSVSPVGAAEPPQSCAKRTDIVQHLAAQNKEQPVAVGLADHGTRLEVLTSPDGTWTLIVSLPNGISCLINAGTDWQFVPRVAAANTAE